MTATPTLPAYSDETLGRLAIDALIDILIRDEDRVPRNVIDECARRGEEMVARLSGLVERGRGWHPRATPSEWWLLLHAVMILGLIASESAGLLLVRFMRRMVQAQDDDLQDWLSGKWPALFQNKSPAAAQAARELCMDRKLDWYMRANAADVVVAAAAHRGSDALDRALAWIAAIAADEREDWDLRLAVANTLIDFPRERYHPLLEGLAARQKRGNVHFSPEDIEEAYAAGRDEPDWASFDDPWAFYDPAAIEQRQRRRAEEDAEAEAADDEDDDFPLYEAAEPQVRATPKVGRNDPCPCGSGRKYKYCCLNKDQEPRPDDLAWRRLQRAIEVLPKGLLRTAREHFGAGAIDEAWAEFNLWNGEDAFDPESPYLQVFLPWFFYDWLPDAEETAVPARARSETAAAAHLRTAGRRLDPLARRYLEACIAAPFSFHEVVACEPGRGFRLRDVLLGTEVDALEHEGSLHARAGGLIYAKAVSTDGLTLIEGCTPVLIPPVCKPAIIELRERLAAQGAALDAGLLREYDVEPRETYLEIADRLLYPRMPQMANTDGDPLEFRELVFDIDSPRGAFDALKGLAAGASEDELLSGAGFDAAGALLQAEIAWRRPDSDTILGSLRIEGGRLTAAANSARRADELRRLIEERLGASGRYRAGTVQSVESLLDPAIPREMRKTLGL